MADKQPTVDRRKFNHAISELVDRLLVRFSTLHGKEVWIVDDIGLPDEGYRGLISSNAEELTIWLSEQASQILKDAELDWEYK